MPRRKFRTTDTWFADMSAGTCPQPANSASVAVGREAFKRQEEAIIGRIDSRPHLKDIRCRTLVIAAAHDQLMPVPVLKELSDGIPGARLEIVDDSGHMASLEQPGRVLELMRGWVKG